MFKRLNKKREREEEDEASGLNDIKAMLGLDGGEEEVSGESGSESESEGESGESGGSEDEGEEGEDMSGDDDDAEDPSAGSFLFSSFFQSIHQVS